MYSYEERIRAVKLYIKLGRRLGATIRQLGSRRQADSFDVTQGLFARQCSMRRLLWPIENRVVLPAKLARRLH